MANKIIVPTGYMGSGSSAVTNILSEIEGLKEGNGDYEYVLLHCPDGIFDLEDKLLRGNNALRSDEALYRFEQCIKTLYESKGYWISMYKDKVSPAFLEYSEKYIGELVTTSSDKVYWYFQQNPDTLSMKWKYFLYKCISKFTSGKANVQIPLKYHNVRIALPSEEKFYGSTRKYLNRFYEDLGYKSHSIVLDQFLLPHNLYRIDHYFDEDLRVIVVDRDPRDVFVLNKYKWYPDKVALPYPLDADDFAKMYAKMRESERIIDDIRVLRIHFEDLVFQYEDSLKKIYQFLEIDEKKHSDKMKFFNPDISIKNTQLFNVSEEIQEECKILEEKLKEYLYSFPGTNKKNTDLKESF